jgi:hypothetical protein
MGLIVRVMTLVVIATLPKVKVVPSENMRVRRYTLSGLRVSRAVFVESMGLLAAIAGVPWTLNSSACTNSPGLTPPSVRIINDMGCRLGSEE